MSPPPPPAALVAAALLLACATAAEDAPALFSVSDYDGGEVYWVRDGRKTPYHGMREAWVFNRALVWLDDTAGLDGALVCYSAQSPLLLTGRQAVSRWYTGKGSDLTDVDDQTTRLVKKDAKADWDHASLPPFQFHIEQNPAAELEVVQATRPWQFLVVVKGRSGPPLYASPLRGGPGKLTVDLLDLYRRKGYTTHFAELHFFIAVAAKDEATVDFRLRLGGREAVVTSLPVVRTAERARREGVPVYAVVVDAAGKRLGVDTVAVAATAGNTAVDLSELKGGLWSGLLRNLPSGQHRAAVTATWKAGGKKAESTLDIRITDGQYIGYDEKLRLLTHAGRPIGPLTGSYRGAPMFKHIGTDKEALVQGQEDWDAVKGSMHEGQYCNHGGPDYGFHFWESLTDKELEADYGYLERCGWSVVHLCQGWWYWERLDSGGRIAPHGAEQLYRVLAAAERHHLRLHLALSHYPLGKQSKPWAQYLEAGYRREDYGKPDAKFYEMFRAYLSDFATIFRDDTALSSYTSAGEGDVDCGKTFVNEVHRFMQANDSRHLFLCEPHLNPRPYPRDMNYYRQAGWTPLVGGMRTYPIDGQSLEHIAVQFKLAAMGHIFLGEGVFWGFMDGPRQTQRYRERVRHEFYAGLAYRLPLQLTWEERVVEDERIVFEKVRQMVDWSKAFQRPRLVLRVGKDLNVLTRYERALSRIPLEYSFILTDDPAPANALHVLDTQEPFADPAFVSDGGKIPDALKTEMPLLLPKGCAASYSWSEDRRVLLAFVHGGAAAPAQGEYTTSEAGRYTYADTTCAFARDTPVDAWEVQCVKPGAIQLCIFRQAGNEMALVGSSELALMGKPGLCRFALEQPIAAQKGDLTGFYIPDEGTHIAARDGGRMLFVKDSSPPARMALASWEAEAKSANIRAFSAAETAQPAPGVPAQQASITLQNFPDEDLPVTIFDLVSKKAILQSRFKKGASLPSAAWPSHLFVVVGGRD